MGLGKGCPQKDALVYLRKKVPQFSEAECNATSCFIITYPVIVISCRAMSCQIAPFSIRPYRTVKPNMRRIRILQYQFILQDTT